MPLYKKYLLLLLCFHFNHGEARTEPVKPRVKHVVNVKTPIKPQDKLISGEPSTPVTNLSKEPLHDINWSAVSKCLAKEALNNRNVKSKGLQAVKSVNKLQSIPGAIFRTISVLWLDAEGWHLTARTIAGILTIIYGSHVFVLLPLLTKIAQWILRIRHSVAISAAIAIALSIASVFS